MSWTAIVPFKGRAARKTRLAPILSCEALRYFSDGMFRHVCDVLAACDSVGDIIVLSDARPSGWDGRVIHDQGRGLNAELAGCVDEASMRRVVVIHADLPLLQRDDVAALLGQADNASMVIAPDRHASGTNALALSDPAGFAFQFGPGSMVRHIEAGAGKASILNTPGLSFDIDTPDDYAAACRAAPDAMKRFVT